MNETRSKTRRKARRFSEEFKQDAVRPVVGEEIERLRRAELEREILRKGDTWPISH